MLVTFEGVIALRSLRLELQEDAGEDFPQSLIPELLVLRDVCKKLELNIFQCHEVLSEQGWDFVNAYIDQPIGFRLATPEPTVNGRRESQHIRSFG